MKRKFFTIAKKYGVQIVEWQSRRHLGSQLYEMVLKNENGTIWRYDTAYFFGDTAKRPELLADFEKHFLSNV